MQQEQIATENPGQRLLGGGITNKLKQENKESRPHITGRLTKARDALSLLLGPGNYLSQIINTALKEAESATTAGEFVKAIYDEGLFQEFLLVLPRLTLFLQPNSFTPWSPEVLALEAEVQLAFSDETRARLAKLPPLSPGGDGCPNRGGGSHPPPK